MCKTTDLVTVLSDAISTTVQEHLESSDFSDQALAAIEEAVDNYDFDKAVGEAIENFNLERYVEDAICDVGIEKQVEEAVNNTDFETPAKDCCDRYTESVDFQLALRAQVEQAIEDMLGRVEKGIQSKLNSEAFLQQLAQAVELRLPLPWYERALRAVLFQIVRVRDYFKA